MNRHRVNVTVTLWVEAETGTARELGRRMAERLVEHAVNLMDSEDDAVLLEHGYVAKVTKEVA